LKSIEGHGGRFLHAVVNPLITPKKVVTVFFDRKASKLGLWTAPIYSVTKSRNIRKRGQFCIIRVREEGEMQTAKQEVSDLLKRLPDDCTLEDVQYHLYVLQKIERGLKDAGEGRVFTQEEVEKMMSKWLEK